MLDCCVVGDLEAGGTQVFDGVPVLVVVLGESGGLG
jgi:hypothetical protein